MSFNARCSQPPLWCWKRSHQGLLMIFIFLLQGWEKVLLFFIRTAGPTLGPWRRVHGGLSRSHSVTTCWNTCTMEPGSPYKCLPILRDIGYPLGKERSNKILEWCTWKRKGGWSREEVWIFPLQPAGEILPLIWWCSKFQMLYICLCIKGEGAALCT